MKLTPFGAAMRLSRLKYRIRQNVMAPAMGLSEQYLSAVETGRKPVHDELLEASIKFFQQIDAGFDADALRTAADQSRRQVCVEALGFEAKALVASLARHLEQFKDMDQAEEVLRLENLLGLK
ncbi:TPA: hypothetical protein RJN57_000537 [Pseudomonas aeruginosa]|nr:hypothetical protein [Escherichia coli]MCO3747603.1 helix-turn-helix domain-containing protein [Pseudomonas aeruginosa]HCF0591532.1 hypothetical protein [Pseudomonas aeruginosa]HCF4081127.1 hypothetical protein [Pseudomonas aeruginosa]HDV6123033.1 hypothetical protein [Pseudomonas aeruginosa]